MYKNGKRKGNIKRSGGVRPYLAFPLLILTVLALAGCRNDGSYGDNDEILLIDEMTQVDFDIDYPVGQITRDVTVTQDFVSNADVITQIWLYGATYMRDNTATVYIRLYLADQTPHTSGSDGDVPNETGEPDDSILMGEWIIDSAQMDDNSIIKLDVDPSDMNGGLMGMRLFIKISSPDGEPDLSPTFWMTEEDVYQDGHLTINGYSQYNDLWFQVVGH